MHTECQFPEFCVGMEDLGCAPVPFPIHSGCMLSPALRGFLLHGAWQICVQPRHRDSLSSGNSLPPFWQLIQCPWNLNISLVLHTQQWGEGWLKEQLAAQRYSKLRAPRPLLSSAYSLPFCLSLSFPQQNGLRLSEAAGERPLLQRLALPFPHPLPSHHPLPRRGRGHTD